MMPSSNTAVFHHERVWTVGGVRKGKNKNKNKKERQRGNDADDDIDRKVDLFVINLAHLP